MAGFAIWDAEAQWWYCPSCYHPLAEDGAWENEDGSEHELFACHECGVEYARALGDTTTRLNECI